MAGDEQVREIDGREVHISSPDKVYFPKLGLTKSDVVDYFLEISDALLNAARNRPTLLQRFPSGVGGNNFFQKRIPDSAPDWLETTTVETVNGTPSRALVLADAAHIAWAANLGAFVLHLWPFRVPTEDVDELRIDLDPTPGVTYGMVRDAAHLVREELEQAGIRSWIKTSGSKGLHVYAPTNAGWDSYDVRGAAVTLSRRLAGKHPSLITDKWWKEERGSRVFIDFNQNAPHKTVFGAWSIRPRVGAQVSTPVAWNELDDIDPNELTVLTVPARLADKGDAWAEMYSNPQEIDDLVAEWRNGLETMGDAPWPPVYPKQPFEPSRVAPSRARAEED
ncbi:MAG: non-homologous end-joining DNA ligase [Acidimicrobiales bacterium]